jgi:hypothetical protein
MADPIETPLWPISGRRAEDWRSQPSVPVAQRVDPFFPGSSGVSSSSSSSFSFLRQSFEGISLARRERWASSNPDFYSGARRMESNVSVHHGGKMSQQNQSGVSRRARRALDGDRARAAASRGSAVRPHGRGSRVFRCRISATRATIE